MKDPRPAAKKLIEAELAKHEMHLKKLGGNLYGIAGSKVVLSFYDRRPRQHVYDLVRNGYELHRIGQGDPIFIDDVGYYFSHPTDFVRMLPTIVAEIRF